MYENFWNDKRSDKAILGTQYILWDKQSTKTIVVRENR